MRTKFLEDLLNSVDKVKTVSLDEKNYKADLIVKVVDAIRKEGEFSVTWKKTKWVVAPK